jgi:membrane protein YdbS with pleckstrin-like domain
MDALTLRPETQQRALWYVVWGIVFAPGTLVLLLLLLANAVVFGLLLVLWLVVMVLILRWIPAYYRSISYSIENDAVRGQAGVFWRRHVTVPFVKITNIDVTQGPLQRAFNLGTIQIQTAGAGGSQGGHAELRLVGIRQLESIRETIREKIRTYDSRRVEQQQAAPPGPTPDQPVLQQILQELQAIRELLKNRQGNGT